MEGAQAAAGGRRHLRTGPWAGIAAVAVEGRAWGSPSAGASAGTWEAAVAAAPGRAATGPAARSDTL